MGVQILSLVTGRSVSSIVCNKFHPISRPMCDNSLSRDASSPAEVSRVNKIQIHEQMYLEQLTDKRNRLFKLLLMNPKNTRPASEIKILDDKIWELRFRK
jgi:hypothetical protein